MMVAMRIHVWLSTLVVSASLFACGGVAQRAQTPACDPPAYSERDVERYIVESEGQWAESCATGKSVAERILADDYLGTLPDGQRVTKAQSLAWESSHPVSCISNHVNDVKVQFLGATVVAYGSESWERRSPEPTKGRYVWTDTWMLRNGKWQIVASDDIQLPP
jgi:hypothetical protein